MKKLLIYIMCTVILLSNIGVTVEASGNRYYAGEYKKKIKGTTYYISMNAYTSFDDTNRYNSLQLSQSVNRLLYRELSGPGYFSVSEALPCV